MTEPYYPDLSPIKTGVAGKCPRCGRGRLVILKSGTEPLVRIMGECDDPDLLRAIVGEIEAEVARYA